MAARRQRTTALPRARPRAAASSRRQFFGVSWGSNHLNFAILGGLVAILLVVLGLYAYKIYDDRYGKPERVILQVGNEEAKLGYYTDRLGPWVQQNSQSGDTVQLLELSLLAKLEQELLGVRLASQQGVDLSDKAVKEFIAGQLGVAAGSPSFDTLYNNQLKSQKISDGTFKKLKKAELANTALLDKAKADIGNSGELYTVRSIVVATQAEAQAALDKINSGTDMGTLAQTTSIDLDTRQQDGIMQAEPLDLFPATVKTALAGKQPGDIIGPVQVEGNWWLLKIEQIATADYSDTQKTQLAQNRVDKQLADEKTQLGSLVKRSLDDDDLKYAEQNAN